MKHLNKILSSVASLSLAVAILVGSPIKAETKELQPQTQAQQNSRIVYGSPLSPFVFKVLVAMAEKGLDFKLVETLPISVLRAQGKEPLEAFANASPLGKIPAYQEGDWSIADSSVITAYLDRKNPAKPLYPSSAEDFAETLWFEQYGDEVMTEVIHHKIFFEKVVKPMLFKKPTDTAILQQAVTEDLPKIFAYLEKALEGKTWIVGDEFTAADIAIGAHLVSLKKSGITISAEKWPNLEAYAGRLLARPSFKKYMA